MSAKEIIQVLEQEKATALMESLYGRAQAEENKKRYQAMVDGYVQTFGDGDIKLFSSPGRTEIIEMETIPITTMARFWQEALIWTVSALRQRMIPDRSALSARLIIRILPLIWIIWR